ncbi:hypothetical protein F5050DRAFT_1898739 [Lentinula boryana]|uniref:Zn(2)-C6 fungal-type domain-containing protein n=1 Tax=Lentinula boryana TaxID=40481 RepID=A0ABQ8PX52_9AGAR|nr:hypothetical protein F5050DRAFT_1898739 [Lentinula boryana]
MSTTSNNNETIQQRRERLLQAQAARQRAREEEIARQEAEFAAEMERIEAEEKAAQEAEEKQRAEEQRIKEEKRQEEEKRVAEERRIAEEQRKKQEELAEKKRKEERRIAEERRRAEEIAAQAEDARERAAKELGQRQKHIPAAQKQTVTVLLPPRSSGSTSKKGFKSRSVISDESDDVIMGGPEVETPQIVKRKRPIKMIAQNDIVPDPTSDRDAEEHDNEDEESLSQPRSACTRCVLLGKTSSCKPQSTRRKTQACEPCHIQRQRCSWIGEHASWRSRGKRAKVEDEIYQGPAARVGERRFEGPGIADQLAAIVGQNTELIAIARRSLGLQERMLNLMVRRERREEETEKSEDEDEDEDEDGEGEEDEEVKEKNDKEIRREEIREGKKRAD